MSKTTRELANLFGVTKQAIEKKYTPEFKAKYMSKGFCCKVLNLLSNKVE
ncbi:hypothetical protein J0J34_09925 (plasmid) [Lactococcus garvieae]|nr:hypothetical protein [Lactococcus garvieae]QSR01185.1 hypothetical protein J0J34_09925 [Lactococcus garvieae]